MLCKAWDKVDPRDVQIIKLTTAVKNETLTTTPRTSTKFNATNEPTVPGMDALELWRTIKKGDTVEKHGKTWNWCTHHKSDKFGYYGLYYHNHTINTQDEWKSSKKSKTEAFATLSGKPLSGKSKSLQISDNVKNYVFTNFFCSKEYLDKIIESQESLN